MNYVFKVFVSKFLTHYIDNFEKSELLLYNGELNINKVHLKLDMINQSFRQMLLPFQIVNANINTLKIDIPWASLNSQPIKTYIQGLQIKLIYQPMTNLDEISTKTPMISIQNEMRKFKEDEKMIKSYIKKLLLNIDFVIENFQLELNVESVNINFNLTKFHSYSATKSQNEDQYYRAYTVEGVDLVQGENSIMKFDNMKGHLEKGKSSIKIVCETNKLQLELSQQIIKIKDMLWLEIWRVRNYLQGKIQPETMHVYIIKDIISIVNTTEVELSINSLQLKTNDLNIKLDSLQCQVRMQQAYNYRVRIIFKKISVSNLNDDQLIKITAIEEHQFAYWPEFDKGIEGNIVIEQNRQEIQRNQLEDFKNRIIIKNIAIQINIQYIHDTLKNKLINPQRQEVQDNEQSKSPTFKVFYRKQRFFKIQFLKSMIHLENDNINTLSVQFQFITELQINQKRSLKLKEMKLHHKILQFEIIDQYKNIVLECLGSTIKYKEKQLDAKFTQSIFKLHHHSQNDLLTNSSLIFKILKLVRQRKKIQQEQQIQIQEQSEIVQNIFKINLNCDQVNIYYGEIGQDFKEIVKLKIKDLIMKSRMNSSYQIENQSTLKVSSSIYHPLVSNELKYLRQIKVEIKVNQNNENEINILNNLRITLNGLVLTSFKKVAELLKQKSVSCKVKNYTNKKLVIKIQQRELQREIILSSGETQIMKQFIEIESSYHHQQGWIQIGVIEDGLQFCCNQFQFGEDMEHICLIRNDFDGQEYQLILKKIENVIRIFSKVYCCSMRFPNQVYIAVNQSNWNKVRQLNELEEWMEMEDLTNDQPQKFIEKIVKWDLWKYDIGLDQFDSKKLAIKIGGQNDDSQILEELQEDKIIFESYSQVKWTNNKRIVFFRNQGDKEEKDQYFFIEIIKVDEINFLIMKPFLSFKNQLGSSIFIELQDKTTQKQALSINMEAQDKHKFFYTLEDGSSPYMIQFNITFKLFFDDDLYISDPIYFTTFPNFLFEKKTSVVPLNCEYQKAQILIEEIIINYSKLLVLKNPIEINNQCSFPIKICSNRFKQPITVKKQYCIPIIFKDDDQIYIQLEFDSKEVAIRIKQLKIGVTNVISFNFIKINDSYYNILIIIEYHSSADVTTITFKPFLILINLLQQQIKLGNNYAKYHDTIHILLPMSTDPIYNNNLIQLTEDNIPNFINTLLLNRKDFLTSDFQLSIQPDQHVYLIPFLKEGRIQQQVGTSHQILMIFRNSSLIDQQLCFLLSSNVYQPSQKYLLVINQSNEYFILVKTKSRLHINPQSNNCFEIKNEQTQIFFSDSSFQLLQLLDNQTLSDKQLQMKKSYFKNIVLLEIQYKNTEILNKKLQINTSQISITLTNTLQIQTNFNLRFFNYTHFDMLFNQFLIIDATNHKPILFSNQEIFFILDFNIISSLKLVLIRNCFILLKNLTCNLTQSTLNSITDFFALLNLDPLKLQSTIIPKNKDPQLWDFLKQRIIFVMNAVIDPFNLDLNLDLNVLNINTKIPFPQYNIKQNKFTRAQLEADLFSNYIALLIDSMPKSNLIFSNLKNSLQFWTNKHKSNIDYCQLYIGNQQKKTENIILQIAPKLNLNSVVFSQKCKSLQLRNKQMNGLSYINMTKSGLIIESKNCLEIIKLNLIKQIRCSEDSIRLVDEDGMVMLWAKSKRWDKFIEIIRQILY